MPTFPVGHGGATNGDLYSTTRWSTETLVEHSATGPAAAVDRIAPRPHEPSIAVLPMAPRAPAPRTNNNHTAETLSAMAEKLRSTPEQISRAEHQIIRDAEQGAASTYNPTQELASAYCDLLIALHIRRNFVFRSSERAEGKPMSAARKIFAAITDIAEKTESPVIARRNDSLGSLAPVFGIAVLRAAQLDRKEALAAFVDRYSQGLVDCSGRDEMVIAPAPTTLSLEKEIYRRFEAKVLITPNHSNYEFSKADHEQTSSLIGLRFQDQVDAIRAHQERSTRIRPGQAHAMRNPVPRSGSAPHYGNPNDPAQYRHPPQYLPQGE